MAKRAAKKPAKAKPAKKGDSKKAGGGKPAKRASTKSSGDTTIKLVPAGPLNKLADDVLRYKAEGSGVASDIKRAIEVVAKQHGIHKGAFNFAVGLKKKGLDDPGKLWLFLAHFDDMRTKMKLDDLATKQGQLLPPGLGKAEKAAAAAEKATETKQADKAAPVEPIAPLTGAATDKPTAAGNGEAANVVPIGGKFHEVMDKPSTAH
jgi:hypothetical protein